MLNAIAKNSDGGTYSDVQNTTDLSVAFANCLGGLLTVAIQDLRLTISPVGKTTIESVTAGDYPQSRDNSNAITIRFGTLYDKETRRVIVNLVLPEVTSETSSRVLRIGYLYRCVVFLPDMRKYVSVYFVVYMSLFGTTLQHL